jgi:serine protease DegQ
LVIAVVAGCGGSSKHISSATVSTPPAGGGIPAVVNRVDPQVVTVLTRGGIGSGVIYRSNGIILTNDHVVRSNAPSKSRSLTGAAKPVA